MVDIVEVDNLKKTFKTRKGMIKAVDGINFKVKRGEVFGFLGPNGAGKTTTMRIITTLIKPDEGTVRVNGHDIMNDPLSVRTNLAYMPQEPKLFPYFSISDQIKMYLSFYGFNKRECKQRCEQILKDLNLVEHKRKTSQQLSTGLKRRVQLARVLASRSPLIFLDEPTAGLDVEARHETWKYIEKIVSKEEITVFLTTHMMKEVENLCDRVAVINKGKLIISGSVTTLIKEYAEDILHIKLTENISSTKKDRIIQSLMDHDEVKDVRINLSIIQVRVKSANRAIPLVVTTLSKEGVSIEEINHTGIQFEEIYLSLIGKNDIYVRSNMTGEGYK